jgi:hypothetical protein
VENLDVVSNRNGRDQAICELARRLPAATAGPVELGGLLIVGGPLDRQRDATKEQTAQSIAVLVVSRTGEYLHHDHIGARKLRFPF